ncbi:adenylyl-sulfate kinase [Janthinobacterium sp. 17J80-10]|uniref:adenylyl-sulfate kinase n=1 Tax=Janthinobacterium sp. 17J80-10 TaxID=2497863 RepID=UPI0010054102|nr:adenylyl-sulfate kinase [Janthinobacterium sp. 17J80-10]QAU35550.1 adenylyl-sulfate kinase [Janthinobacterium sp. 17J80-10]
MNNSTNVVWHRASVTRAQRQAQNLHPSVLLWFTGLSGSGKSSLAHAVEEKLHGLRCRTFVLDGDNVRHGLCGDLGFSNANREENIRRVGEVAKLFIEAGVITLTAFISPFAADRERVRGLFSPGDFIEIYCRCSLETCESRDTKGLYKQAHAGKIADFTGVSSPYEAPAAAELVIDTDQLDIESSVAMVLRFLQNRGIILSD